MTKEQAIEAILIPPQLEAFCKRFDLRAEDIEPNFSGWSKHILMSSEYVFLFPRHFDYELYTLHELHCTATRGKPSAVYGSLEEEWRAVLNRLLDATERISSENS